jgi:lysozyme
MKLNQATINRIKQSEGLRLAAYPDPGSKDGLPITIGYGTTRIDGKPVPRNLKITEQQAEQYLRVDLEKFADGVRKLIKVKLNNNQFGALVSFAYNIGLEAFKNSTLLRLLNSGDYSSVPAQMRRWNKNDGKVMKGLINRREDEIKLWLTPSSATPLESTGEPADGRKDTQAGEDRENIFIVLLRLVVKLLNGGRG